MHAAAPDSNHPDLTRRATMRLLALLGVVSLSSVAHADDAPGYPADAFHQKNPDEAIKKLYGKPFEASDKVTLDAPEIAENGAVVPVSVSTTLTGVTSISIFVPENPFALAASYVLTDATLPQIGCRLKMAKTSNVIAIVEAGGKLYAATKEVKVTLGGCGG
jgi:sulfur-oxidizing protein SoxY